MTDKIDSSSVAVTTAVTAPEVNQSAKEAAIMLMALMSLDQKEGIAAVEKVCATAQEYSATILRAERAEKSLVDLATTLNKTAEAQIADLISQNDVLKAAAAALVEALREIVGYCGNDGYGNPIVNERIVDRCDETARAAITAWEVGE